MQWNRISTYRGRMVRLNGVPVPDVTRTILPEYRLVSFRLSSSSRYNLSLTCMNQIYLMNNQWWHKWYIRIGGGSGAAGMARAVPALY